MNSCGIFRSLRYFATESWVVVPIEPKIKATLLHFDQLARLVPGAPRHEAVVDADQVDPAAIDAALIVDHLHVGLLGQTGNRESGARTGIRHGLADLDLVIGHPRRVLGGRRQCHGAAQEQAAEQARKHAAPGIRRSGDEISDQRRRRCRARVPGGHAAAPPNKRAETKRDERKRDEITSFQWIGLHWPAPSQAIRWLEMSQQVCAP